MFFRVYTILLSLTCTAGFLQAQYGQEMVRRHGEGFNWRKEPIDPMGLLLGSNSLGLPDPEHGGKERRWVHERMRTTTTKVSRSQWTR
jgi:hypothetical protein